MAITLSSLIPAKSSTGVVLTSTLSFTITSTLTDLDLDSITFTINGIDADITAAYGASNLIVNFSRSLSDFEYGLRYACSVHIENTTEELDESFVFETEEGVFRNTLVNEYKYFHSTQELANYTPESSKSRYDRFSNFQQFVNSFGGQVDDLDNLLFRQLANYYIQTTNLNDLSKLYKVELPGNFNFSTTLLDDGSLLYKPPTTYGYLDFNKFPLDPDFSNDLFSFYYKRLPDRLTIETEAFGSTEILEWTDIDNDVFSVDHELSRFGGFVIELRDCNKFAVVERDEIILLSCRIKGRSQFGQKQEETIGFIENGISYSKKSWNKIDSIEFYELPDGFSGQFKLDYFPPTRAEIRDFYKYADLAKIRFIAWKLDDGEFGSVLQNFVDKSTDPVDKVRDPERELVREYELVDVDGTTALDLIDFTVDEYYNYIYGIDSDYLYIFDKLEDYPRGLRVLSTATKDPVTVLELQTNEYSREATGKEIQFRVSQLVFGKRVNAYRLKLLKPDGSVIYIKPAGETTLVAAEAWVVVPKTSSNFRSQQFTTDLADLGDYYLTLEVRYKDGTVDRDIKIIRALYKQALIKYKLEKFSVDDPVRMFFDFDQKLKVLDADENLHEITFHRDNVLIDYEDRILYFNEDFDKVELDGI